MEAKAAALSVTLRSPKPMVTQSNELSAKGRRSASATMHSTLPAKPCVEQPIAADLQHARIDVRQDHPAVLADLAQKPPRQIAGAAGDVERVLPGLQGR